MKFFLNDLSQIAPIVVISLPFLLLALFGNSRPILAVPFAGLIAVAAYFISMLIPGLGWFVIINVIAVASTEVPVAVALAAAAWFIAYALLTWLKAHTWRFHWGFRLVLAVIGAAILALCSYNLAGKLFQRVAVGGSTETLTLFIKAGVNVDVRDGPGGRTPLMIAAAHNPNPEAIRVLIQAGADVNARGYFEQTPLMKAASRHHNPNPEVIRILVQAGADVNARDHFGYTPLMLAAMQPGGHPEAITFLLDSGANPKLKANNGKMAIDYARERSSLIKSDALRKLEEASR